ncbi:hypothetical protein [Pseudomonas extremaustralis]|uniref:hypothetical protein n=1 Tax=Pseudomonas extremaustralis TaxID=359110 RepID=UPI001239EA78|nr:hypothetical protein [Pseudomonas extremaustralis]
MGLHYELSKKTIKLSNLTGLNSVTLITEKAALAGAGAAWIMPIEKSVHEYRDQDDHRDRHAEEPQQ